MEKFPKQIEIFEVIRINQEKGVIKIVYCMGNTKVRIKFYKNLIGNLLMNCADILTYQYFV